MLKSKKGIARKRGVTNERFYCSVAASALSTTRSVKEVVELSRRDTDLIIPFVHQIKRELITNFGKTSSEAQVLIRRAKLRDYLSRHPIALHDSPHEWAVKLLTKNNDVETLERYYMS